MIRWFLTFLLLPSMALHAQNLSMTDETSDVKFHARHLAGRLDGTFKGVKGTASFHPDHISTSWFKFKFDAATVVIDDSYVGPNLIKQDCFYPAKYQYIELTSTSISKLPGPNKYQFSGMLTARGITKPISFLMTATANAGGYDFTFDFNLNKKPYNLHCGATGKEFKFSIKTYGKRD